MNKFISKAAQAASFSDYPQYKLGCVVVYRKSIIAVGFNSKKTHPIQSMYNKLRNFEEPGDNKFHPDTLHAEIHALSQCKYMSIDFNQVTVYIARMKRSNNKYGMARPCPACLGYLKALGIRDIVYTTNDGIAKERLYYE